MANRKKVDTGLKNSLDSILENYGVPDEPLTVTLPKGEQLTFSVPGSLEELRGVISAAVSWWEMIHGKSDVAGHPFAGVIPKTREQAIDAYLIATFSLVPKLSEKWALTFVMKAGWAAFGVSQAIKTHWRDMETLWLAEATTEAKKNLSETSSEGLQSESLDISTDDTPTT